jgi:hypothetical protein
MVVLVLRVGDVVQATSCRRRLMASLQPVAFARLDASQELAAGLR